VLRCETIDLELFKRVEGPQRIQQALSYMEVLRKGEM
jgi:hypothetical protein